MAFGRSSESRSGGGAGRPRGNRPRYIPKRRVCAFCADKSKTIDFRDPNRLRRYISERAKIEGRRKTATCAKHQRQMAEAIKRARHLAMLPFTLSHIRQSGIGGFRPPAGGRFAPAGERPPLAQPAPAQPAAQAPAAVTQGAAPATQTAPATEPAAQQGAEAK